MADLRQFRALARNWEAIGDADPMFGVLSDPAKHGGKWDAAEFFASGRAHVETLLRMLTDARAGFERGTCLDFGCGVGRLTLPLAELFQRTIGVDVALPMIEAARRHQPPDLRCEFIVNRDPDLRRFESGTFDLVHSSLVLQHISADVTPVYIAEFFRIARPGGLVVFQLPAETRGEHVAFESHALPGEAYAATLAFLDPPSAIATSAFATVRVRVTNRSTVTWPHDIPAGRHICLGNHWLQDDGTRLIDDDARALLPYPVLPGATAEIPLTVQAPDTSGRYLLEVDLVQEHTCWFSDRGSVPARTAITVAGDPPRDVQTVSGPRVAPQHALPSGARARRPLLRRLLRRLRGGRSTFEMHVMPRVEVERTIQANGGRLLRAVDDNAAGPRWLSYTYICRRL